jgi:uncharacterized protein (DUF433 family)
VQAIQPELPPILQGADGVIRIAGTRVTLDSLVASFDAGATPEEIVQQFPSLSLPDTYATISYLLNHRIEVDRYLLARHSEATKVRAATESRLSPAGIRARLLDRRTP